MEPQHVAKSTYRARPRFVSVYVALMGITGASLAVPYCLAGIYAIEQRDDLAGLYGITAGVGIAAAYFVLARGLLNLRRWAWWVVIGLHAAAFVLLVVDSRPEAIVACAIGGYVVYWFFDNKHIFA